MRTKLATALITIFIFAVISFAQDKKPPPRDEEQVIKVDTELVDVPLIVTDRTGKPLLGLEKKNFAVYEDNKLQSIADFVTTSAPFEVALLLDTSGSTRSEIDLIKRSAQSFIDSLRPGDRVSIIAYRSTVEGARAMAVSEVLTELTGDRESLRKALEKVTTSNGTPYYDGMLQIASKVFKDAPKEQYRGRRALVALTDGVDSTSASDFDEVSEVFEKLGVVTYFIKVDTQQFFEENLLGDCESAMRFSRSQIQRYYRKFYPNADVEKVTNFCQLGDFERLAISKKLYDLAASEMTAMAKASGGRVFPVDDLSQARVAFKRVADEIGTKYSLGYYSSNERRDGSYRRIRVEPKALPPGTQIRAREGYRAPLN